MIPTSAWLPLSRGHKVLVAAATLLVTVACLAVTMNLATLHARDRYAQETSPRLLATFEDEDANLRWQPYWDSVDDRTVHVVLAQPLTDEAPPPLGLSAWPDPGEFAISADLEPDLSEIENRWGELSALIPEEALPAADSRIMVYRPEFDLSSDWDASGYGVPEFHAQAAGSYIGTMTMWRIPPGISTGGVTLALLPVSLLALAIAIRRSTTRHQQRFAALEAAGVPASILHRNHLRAHGASIILGLALGAAAGAALLLVDLPIPLADYTSRAIDMRGVSPQVIGALLVSAVLVLAVASIATHPPRLSQAVRPMPRPPTLLRLALAVLCVVSTLVFSELSVWSVRQELAGRESESVLATMAGGLIAMLTLTALMHTCLQGISRCLRARGHRKGSATSLLISSALVRGSPPAIAAAVATLVVITSIAASWSLMGQVPAIQAQRAVDQIDGRFATVASRSEQTAHAVEQLPGVEHMTIDSTLDVDEHGRTIDLATMYASPEVLQQWGLTPGVTMDAAALPHDFGLVMASGATEVTVADEVALESNETNGVGNRSFLLLPSEGSRLDLAEIQHDLSRWDSPLTAVEFDGEGWIVGANDLAHEMRWVVFLGGLAAVILIGTLWLRSYDDHRDRSVHLAPLETLFAPHSVVRRVHMGVAVITSASSALVGGVIGALLARSTSGDLTPAGGSLPIVLALAAVALVAGLSASMPLALWSHPGNWAPQEEIPHG